MQERTILMVKPSCSAEPYGMLTLAASCTVDPGKNHGY